MSWITVKEAIIATGRGERTIRRWVNRHKNEPTHIDTTGAVTLINAAIFAKDYPIKEDRHGTGNGNTFGQATDKTSQMQIVSYSETIKELSTHLKSRDEEIKSLLHRKSTVPFWLVVGFIVLLLIVGCVFGAYTYQMSQIHNTEIERQKESSSNGLKAKQVLIENQKQTITQQRQELAEKDRLISELYNDTKAQNKKLLELTESLQSKSAKNDTRAPPKT